MASLFNVHTDWPVDKEFKREREKVKVKEKEKEEKEKDKDEEKGMRLKVLLYNKVMELIECPVCYEYCIDKIKQCTQGHIICASCSPKLNGKCPICRCTIHQDIKCLVLEKLREYLRLKCTFTARGCNAEFSMIDKNKHELICGYRDIRCLAGLMSQRFSECEWRGRIEDAHNHVIYSHANSIDKIGLFNRCLTPVTLNTRVSIAKLIMLNPGGWTYLYNITTMDPSIITSQVKQTERANSVTESIDSVESKIMIKPPNADQENDTQLPSPIVGSIYRPNMDISIPEVVPIVLRFHYDNLISSKSAMNVYVYACVHSSIARYLRYSLEIRLIKMEHKTESENENISTNYCEKISELHGDMVGIAKVENIIDKKGTTVTLPPYSEIKDKIIEIVGCFTRLESKDICKELTEQDEYDD